MPRKDLVKAVAYFRTSSTTNVGADKDSEKRQREAVMSYARSSGHEVVGEFYDAAVSGADPVDARPGSYGVRFVKPFFQHLVVSPC
jgi:DNA invertase Pin-like site-specific DNA recombinase